MTRVPLNRTADTLCNIMYEAPFFRTKMWSGIPEILQELTNSTGYASVSQSKALSKDKETSGSPTKLSMIFALILRQSSRVITNILRRPGAWKSAFGQTALIKSSSLAQMQWSGNVTLDPEPINDTNSAQLASWTRIFWDNCNCCERGYQSHILKQ